MNYSTGCECYVCLMFRKGAKYFVIINNLLHNLRIPKKTSIPFSRLLSHIKVKLSTHKVQVSYIAFELSTFRFRISNISIRFSWIAFHGSILTIGSSKSKIQFSSYEKSTFHNLNSNFQFQRWIFQYNKMNFPQLKFNFKHLFFIFPCLYFSLVYKFHIDHE